MVNSEAPRHIERKEGKRHLKSWVATRSLVAVGILGALTSVGHAVYYDTTGINKEVGILSPPSTEKLASAKGEILIIQQQIDRALSEGRALPVLSNEDRQRVAEEKQLIIQAELRNQLKQKRRILDYAGIFGGAIVALIGTSLGSLDAERGRKRKQRRKRRK